MLTLPLKVVLTNITSIGFIGTYVNMWTLALSPPRCILLLAVCSGANTETVAESPHEPERENCSFEIARVIDSFVITAIGT